VVGISKPSCASSRDHYGRLETVPAIVLAQGDFSPRPGLWTEARRSVPQEPLSAGHHLQSSLMFYRSDNRTPDQLRPVSIIPDFITTAEGSALIEVGNTRVICTASIEETVPTFMRNSGKGWISSEYAMIPRATLTRSTREVAKGRQSGRTHEIQRLIGRSLRAVTDLARLGERTIWIDCDVIQADGGTRTASITGAFVALGLALEKLVDAGTLTSVPLRDFVAAVSVGMVDGEVLLDLCYEEDSRAEVDMNFVMTAGYKMVEVQATAERQAFDEAQFAKMLAFARQGVQSLIAKQQGVLSGLTLRQ
jgi:ribonuclease PH